MTNFKEKSVKKQKNGKFCYLKQEKLGQQQNPEKGYIKKGCYFQVCSVIIPHRKTDLGRCSHDVQTEK